MLMQDHNANEDEDEDVLVQDVPLASPDEESDVITLVQVDEEHPQRYRALAILATSTIFGMATWFSASAVVAQLKEMWNLSPSLSPFLTIMVQIGFVFGALCSSAFHLSDWINPRTLMLAGSFGAALFNTMIVFWPVFGFTLCMRFFTGACLALVYPPGLKAISTWFKKGRGIALGVMVGALTLGSAFPHFVNGVGGLNWMIVIICTSVFSVFGGLIAFFIAKDGPFPFPKSSFKLRQTLKILQDVGFRYTTLGYIGHMFELYACWSWFLIFMNSTLDSYSNVESSPHFNIASISTFVVIGIGSIGCWLGGYVADNYWGRTTTVSVCLAISGSCCVLIGMVRFLPWLTFLIGIVWGMSIVGDSAQFSTMLTEVISDQSLVGTALSLQMASGFLLTNLTIFLIPLLESQFTWTWTFAFLSLGPVVGIAAMMKLKTLPEAKRIAGGKS